ncbi:MAG: PAS domain S-box protein [Anaerolineae bacterium]|jgi:PAS domain S-box-containing protein
MTKAQILIVEDEILIAEGLRHKLKHLGYTIPAIATSGQEAVRQAGEIRPDLVLMDIILHGDMDGIQAAEQIHTRFDIPIVYLTANTGDDLVQRAKITEPFGYILKPYEPRELVSTIEMALYRHQMTQELRASEERFRLMAEISPDLIFQLDLEGRITYCSPAIEQVLSFTPQEVVGTHLSQFFPPAGRAQAMQNLGRAAAAERVEIAETQIVNRAAGTLVPVEITLVPITKDRQVIGTQGVARDITERKQTEAALQERVKELNCLYGISTLVEQAGTSLPKILDGIVALIPPAWQYPEITCARISLADQKVETADWLETPWQLTHDVLVSGRPAGWIQVGYLENRPEEHEGPFLKEEQDLIRAIAERLGRIVQRIEAEEALHISLEKYRVLFESFPLGITVADKEGRILEGNKASEQLLNLSREEHEQREIGGAEWQIVRPDGSPMPPDEYASVRALRENQLVENVEMGIVKKDGAITWINVTAAPIPLQGHGVAVAYGDITERKQAEEGQRQALANLRESEAQLRAIGDNLPAGQIFQLRMEADGTARFTHLSAAVERLHECSVEDALNDPTLLFNRVVKEDVPAWQKAMEKSIREMSVFDHTMRIRRNSGEIRWHRMISKPRLADDNAILFDGIDLDITESKRKEEQIQASLREKEVLLREIHHRVKNNLQIVVTLLDLQSDTTDDEETRLAFLEIQNRLQAMARVHEQLYDATDLAQIDMSSYVDNLLCDLTLSYAASDLVYQLDAGDVRLSIEQALPCGMIVSELISNALKHAFPAGQEKRIDVEMATHDGECLLVVADRGVGLPASLDLESSETLGLKLVEVFTKQLGGKLDIEHTRPQGTTFRVSFPRQ